jgi:predicted nucleotidyltransferase
VNLEEVKATLQAHDAELRELGVLHVDVFGSMARGEATKDSDIDLLVAFDGARRYTLLDHERVQRRLGALLGVPVDVTVRPMRKERFRERVERELVRAF